MPMFDGEVLKQTIAVANRYKIEPAALLTVVEVESAGRARENDNRTPRLLFERHVFYRELKKAGTTAALNRAVAQGLAHEGWRPGSQYKDQGTSAARLTLLQRARAINEECANRSCSWGVGQTMGFLAEDLKFANATHMCHFLVEGGVPAQVDCMAREIVRKGLVKDLNEHNWEAFARAYNGPGYKKNSYHAKMAAAYSHWKSARLRRVDDPEPVTVPNNITDDKPLAGETGKIVAGATAGATGVAATLWAFVDSSIQIQTIIVVVGLLVLAILTVVILARRRTIGVCREPLGNLSSLDGSKPDFSD